MRFISFIIALTIANSLHAVPTDYFAIHVIDDVTGRGVPLVELHTTYKQSYFTDSAGYVAFLEPGLMGKEIWFSISSPGYEAPKSLFDERGVALKCVAGQSAEIKLHRTQIAERMYRITGVGIYRDSVLLGKPAPIAEPLINSLVCGSDTVQVAIFRNRYFWFWQDTDRLSFVLGNYSMTGATASVLPDKINLDRGIDFKYFSGKDGFARPMAHVPIESSHPIWVDGLSVVKDDHGDEKMLARYSAVNKDMSPIEQGLMLWDEKAERFEALKKFDSKESLTPTGHPAHVQIGSDAYLYFPSPYLLVRVRAAFAEASDPGKYEAYTCLKPGVTEANVDSFNRDANGKLKWSWQRNAKPARPGNVDAWVKEKWIEREQTPFQLVDIDSGKSIHAASGSVAWNPILKKWTMLFNQQGGDSNLGEMWLATSNTPEGPWHNAKKVATHAKLNGNTDCYNPILHEELMRDNGRFVYFEGTVVNTFSGNPKQTPYYDYNNVMYRVDVGDPRLAKMRDK